MPDKDDPWPQLDWLQWRETAVTLQLWTQIVGKTRLALTPWLNHSWHVPFYLSASGLAISPIFAGDRTIEFEFDFLRHQLAYRDSGGADDHLPLRPQSVAAFHAAFLDMLRRHNIEVAIHPVPNEVPDPVPFAEDETHAAYDGEAAQRFWRALLAAARLFQRFRTGFLGKASPVHFFWGSFDLAVTRFSGRPAPLHPGGVPHLPDEVTREAYSHEVSSAGFWPGSDAFPRAAFYSYAYPAPQGFEEAQVEPSAAYYDTELAEFILPYEDVRRAADPDAAAMAFLHSTYDAAADKGGWDRGSLDCPIGTPGVPRAL